MNRTGKLTEQFVEMQPSLLFDVVGVTEDVYDKLNERYNAFKEHTLVSAFEFDEDWTNWEMHPEGDEVAILLTGEAVLLFDTEEGEVRHLFSQPLSFIVIPKGVWHRAEIKKPSKMMFITIGAGTLQKPVVTNQ